MSEPRARPAPAPRRAGRPRADGPSRTGQSSAEDVLAAAAELFTSQGFAATSTRAVAERAGLRQASLYHLFDSKDAILAALLDRTVRRSLATARLLARRGEPATVRLWALCHHDVRLLCDDPVNLGALSLSPEVDPARFPEFHRRRTELRACYAGLVAESAPDALLGTPPEVGDLIFGLVQSVVLRRRDNPTLAAEGAAAQVADAALRLLGTGDAELARVRSAGRRLLRLLAPQPR